ncbi:sporulation integral membrane protein YlbJ [Proteiniborus sp.]|uniref:sporulation integral membrane protein YlbJ n=1 Tax=Proteiniborus sp. TaxID=2079015 RepID=UPI00332D31BC
MTKYMFILPITVIVFFAVYLFNKKKFFKLKNIKTYLLALLVIFFVSSLIIFPYNTINAALKGLKTWANIVLPSLMPFFIGAEMLIGLGVVNFIGVLLNPIMQPLFGVSGEGSFSFAMSIASGYPVGVSLISKLRQQKIINRIEAQRLVSFCSTSGPLFMIGAVSVGMFNNPSIGALLTSSHYLGAITTGIIFRNYGCFKAKKSKNVYNKKNYLKSAFKELIEARKRDGRSISILMNDSIKSALEAMFMVGGFIIIYSVIIEILATTGVINFLSSIIKIIIPINLDTKLVEGFISGLLEMTNGCKLVSEAKTTSIITQLCTVSFLIGWSGFSIHSQSISMINLTDISSKLYLLSKVLHALFSSMYCYGLYKMLFNNIIVASFLASSNSMHESILGNWLKILKFSIGLELIFIIVVISISIVIGSMYSIKSLAIKK